MDRVPEFLLHLGNVPVAGGLVGPHATAPLRVVGAFADRGATRIQTINLRVTDASGNPVSGVSVTFAVASGGGTVTGGVATTNSGGIATWTCPSWTSRGKCRRNNAHSRVAMCRPSESASMRARVSSSDCSVSVVALMFSMPPGTPPQSSSRNFIHG